MINQNLLHNFINWKIIKNFSGLILIKKRQKKDCKIKILNLAQMLLIKNSIKTINIMMKSLKQTILKNINGRTRKKKLKTKIKLNKCLIKTLKSLINTTLN